MSTAASLSAPVTLPATRLSAESVKNVFSFDWLTERAEKSAETEYVAPQQVHGTLAELNYDDYQKIRFRPSRERWRDSGSNFRLQAFHPGWLFKEPVIVNEIVGDTVRQMSFTAADFEYDGINSETTLTDYEILPGVAGFRLHTPINRADIFDELIAFRGASYFRALGRGNSYGLSARGLVVNTGLPEGEEFPRFSEVWLQRPEPDEHSLTLYAALDGPSVAGAYRFVITAGETTTVDVTARLFLREDISQIGIAPLTSMFLFNGADRGAFDDYRAAVHDSEALVVNTATADALFRPLNNPPQLANSYIGVSNLRSFGLIQRNRSFEHFLDAQANFGSRPSLIVEPIGDWGPGAVWLVEIPSDLEIYDNIVTAWLPDKPTRAGDAMEFTYRLNWGMAPPKTMPSSLARVLRTRAGHGSMTAVEGKPGTRKFVIDFVGGLLERLPGNATLEPVVSVTNGELYKVDLSLVDGKDQWRLVLEVQGEDGRIVELKAGISGYGRNLTETWMYQWINT